jgi:hypothetical protein
METIELPVGMCTIGAKVYPCSSLQDANVLGEVPESIGTETFVVCHALVSVEPPFGRTQRRGGCF